MKTTLTEFDSAEYLTDKESIVAYLGDAFENEDAAGIVDALRIVVRASGGVSKLAGIAEMPERTILCALSETDAPDFAAILAVLHGLGVRLTTSMVA